MKNVFKAPLKYESFKLDKGELYIKNLLIGNEFYDLKIDEIKAKINFSFKSFEIRSDLFFNRPNVVLRNIPFDLKNFGKEFFNRKSFIKTKINISDGKLKVDGFSEYSFCLNQKDFVSSYHVLLSKAEANSQLLVDISGKEGGFEGVALCKEFALEEIFSSLGLFSKNLKDKIERVQGKVNGNFSFCFQKNEKPNFSADLIFSNFYLKDLFFHKSLKTEKLKLNINSFHGNEKCFFANNFCRDFKIHLVMDKGDVGCESQSLPLFENLFVDLFYNPEVGPKISLKANAYVKNVSQNKKEEPNFTILPFKLNARGYFSSDFCNWFDVDFSVLKVEDEEKLFVKLLEKEKDEFVLNSSLSNVGPDLFSLVHLFFENNSLFKELQFLSGKIDSEVESSFFKGKKPKFWIKNFKGNNLSFSIKEKMDLFLPEIEGLFKVDLQKDISQTLTSSLKISDGRIIYKVPNRKNIEAKKINGSFSSKEGRVIDSEIFAYLQNLKTNISLSGRLTDLLVNAELKGCSKELLDHSEEDSLSALLTFKKKKEGGFFSGIVHIVDQEKEGKNTSENIVFGMTIKDIYSFNKKSFFSSLWFRTENVSLEKFQKLFFVPDCQLKGRANLTGFLKKEKLSLQCHFKDLFYENKYYSFNIDKLGNFGEHFSEKKENVLISYDFASNKWDFAIPEVGGKYYLKKFDLNFFCKKAKINIKDNLLELVLPDVLLENIKLAGKLFVDFADKESPKLDIVTESGYGNICDLKNVVGHFDQNLSLPNDLKGTFECKDRGFYFSKILNEKKADFIMGCSLYFKDIDYKISDDIHLINNSFCFDWNNRENSFDITCFTGKIKLHENDYLIFCPLFSKKADMLSYDLRLGKETLDLVRIKGKALFSLDEINLEIDKELSHLFGIGFDIESFVLDKKLNISALNMTAKIDWEKSLSFIGFFPSRLLQFFSHFKNEVFCKFYLSENKEFCFKAHSENFYFKDKKMDKFLLEGRKKGNSFFVDKFFLDDLALSFSIDQKDDKLKILKIRAEKKASFIEGEGEFNINDKKGNFNLSKINVEAFSLSEILDKFSLEKKTNIAGSFSGKGYINYSLEKNAFEADLDLDFCKFKVGSISLENEGPMNLFYSNSMGVKASGLNFLFSSDNIDLSLLKAHFKYINYNFAEKKLTLDNGQLYIPKELLLEYKNICPKRFNDLFGYFFSFFNFEKDLDFGVSIEYYLEKNVVKAYSNDALFYINGKRRNLKNLSFYQDNYRSVLNFYYLIEEKYHRISNVLEGFSSINGRLIVGEESDPLQIFWIADNEGIKVKRIIGNYSGCFASFSLQEAEKEDSYSLIGDLKVDCANALSFFSKEMKTKLQNLHLGKGYNLKGNIHFSKQLPKFLKFEGKLIGKDFQAFNYSLKTMLSDISVTENRIKMSNFKLSDRAGIIEADQIQFDKRNDIWNLSIPLIKLMDCRPSLLKKIGEEKEEIKPLLIKQFKIEKLKGNLSDLSTISGKGNFSFLNSFKRSRSIIEAPADVLGRILGLDLDLLVPVIGDVFFEIKNKKVLFTKINNVYSENNRSKFFLLDVPYMDFDGNLNINIKMKQYVLFKITDKFILSIKGNVSKPDFTLKKRKLFQSNS